MSQLGLFVVAIAFMCAAYTVGHLHGRLFESSHPWAKHGRMRVTRKEIEAHRPGWTREWPDPSPEDLDAVDFNAVWDCIKSWDINVPEAYEGYSGATGNHVRAILDALRSVRGER